MKIRLRSAHPDPSLSLRTKEPVPGSAELEERRRLEGCMRAKNRFNTWIKAAICSISAHLSSFFKFSYIFGSKAAFFNASQSISPLIGFWSGPLACSLVFALRTGFSWVTAVKTVPYILLLSLHLPTLCGALYLASNSRILKALMPLLAIAVFVTHPTSRQAYYYSFYWFIPALIAFVNSRSIFLQALGSTFITHAAGTIIWLYTHSLTAQDWQLLTSIVWLERLVLALGMTCVYYVVNYIRSKISHPLILPYSAKGYVGSVTQVLRFDSLSLTQDKLRLGVDGDQAANNVETTQTKLGSPSQVYGI